MRIFYLSADPGVPVLGHKGASVHVREMARALCESGAVVEIASPRIEPEGATLGSRASLTAIPGVLPKQHTHASTLASAIDDQARVVQRAAQDARADVIYERFSLFSTAGVRAAAALGIPHLLEVNAPLRDEAMRFRQLPHQDVAAIAEREVLCGSDAIVAVSEPLAEWIRGTGCRTPVEVLANAVNPARFSTLGDRPTDRVIAGFAGSLKPWHGIDVMVSACAIAMQQSPTLHVEIVGDGPMGDALRRAELPPERVTFHGAVQHCQAVRLMGGWHAGLAPYTEIPGFYFSPLKVLEYMAAGACPIASDLGQIRSLLGGGERGVLVAPGDSVALAEALVNLTTDPATAARRAEAARAYVLDTHTWQGNADNVIAMVSRVAGRRAA